MLCQTLRKLSTFDIQPLKGIKNQPFQLGKNLNELVQEITAQKLNFKLEFDVEVNMRV